MQKILCISLCSMLLAGCAAAAAYHRDEDNNPHPVNAFTYLFRSNPNEPVGPSVNTTTQGTVANPNAEGLENAHKALSY